MMLNTTDFEIVMWVVDGGHREEKALQRITQKLCLV